MSHPLPPRPATSSRRTVPGIGDLARGLAMVAARPRAMALGLVPPLITSVIVGAALWGLWLWLESQRRAWPAGQAGMYVGFILQVVVMVGGVLVGVLAFSAITLTIGAPIYERVSAHIDEAVSQVPAAPAEPWRRMVPRAIGQALITVLLSASGAVACLLLNAIPAVGVLIGAAASFCFGGWMMARELTGPALERRGLLTLAERGRVLRTRPLTVLAFGIPAFWLLALPGVAIVLFPGAVAGGTLLTRRLLGEPVRTVRQPA